MKELTMGFKVVVNHDEETISVSALAPYSYDELSVLFCALGTVLDAIEKEMKKGDNK